MPVVYLGARTGRDGVGGATMASAEFDDAIEEKRPTVQVGDPFTEKRLMEACLELMALGAVISIQDMGAAGLTCSARRDGRQGRTRRPPRPRAGAGARGGHDRLRDDAVGAKSGCSWSCGPEKEAEARAVFEKWDLDFAVVGETIPEDRFLIRLNGEVKADLPLKALSGAAPSMTAPGPGPRPRRPWARSRSLTSPRPS
jgi:phosphoribosylformylglycinamidine synthase